MSDENKRNLLYFEAASMKALYDSMSVWQGQNQKRLLSVSVQKDGGKFCCIALENPIFAVIVSGGSAANETGVTDGYLWVRSR